MSTCMTHSIAPPVIRPSYGAMSPASDTVSQYPDAIEEEREGFVCICREIEPLRHLRCAGIALDANQDLSCVRLHGWSQGSLVMAKFVPFANVTVGVTWEEPEDAWLASTFEKLEELRSLPEDWDHEGSPGIPDDIVVSVADALCSLRSRGGRTYPAPSIVPVPGGKVQMEWRRGDKYFEIEFLDSQRARYVYYERGNLPRPGRMNAEEVWTLSRILEQMFT